MKKKQLNTFAFGTRQEVDSLMVPGSTGVLFFAQDTKEGFLKTGGETFPLISGTITSRQIITAADIHDETEIVVVQNPSHGSTTDLCIVPRHCFVRFLGGDTAFNQVAFNITYTNPSSTLAFTAADTILNGSTNIIAELTNALPAELRISGGSSQIRGSNLVIQYVGDPGQIGDGTMEIITDYTIEKSIFI